MQGTNLKFKEYSALHISRTFEIICSLCHMYIQEALLHILRAIVLIITRSSVISHGGPHL